MKTVELVARILLGLAMTVFGANKFFWFMPAPDMSAFPEEVQVFNQAFGYYLVYAVGFFEVVGGLMVLSGKYMKLGLLFLFVLLLNVVLYHIFMMPEGIIVGLVLFALTIFLMVRNIEAYKPLLKP